MNSRDDEEGRAKVINFIRTYVQPGSVIQARVLSTSNNAKKRELLELDSRAREINREKDFLIEEKFIAKVCTGKKVEENLRQASLNRNCDNFYFHNYTKEESLDKLGERMDGAYIVRPHEEFFNRLVIDIKLSGEPLLVYSVHVLEECKKKEEIMSIGSRLRILNDSVNVDSSYDDGNSYFRNGTENVNSSYGDRNSYLGHKESGRIFRSIDDLIYNSIIGVSEKLMAAREMAKFRYGNEEEVEGLLKEGFESNGKANYAISYSYRKPGVLVLSYILKKTVCREVIRVEKDGYVFRKEKFERLSGVVAEFKKNPFRR